jgi:glycerate kinase
VRIVCAPDSLKGALAAPDAAAALAEGARRVDGVDADELPLGDGGEGTAEAIRRAVGGEWRSVNVRDPLGRPVGARYLDLGAGRAVVESAEAIGLALVAREERDPLRSSSAGLGELLLAAVGAGARDVVVTLGGSATVDGGSGLREVVGADLLAGVRLRIACDVRNPLLGERGAARVFGPQKGATPEVVEALERRLASMQELAPYARLPGAGAAGGLGAALAALGGELVPGAALVLETVSFRSRIEGAAAVITGEGQVDRTSSEGKLPGAVAAACRSALVPCVVFGGRVAGGAERLYRLGAAAVLPLSGRRERARRDLVGLGEAIARLAAAFAARP